MSKNQASKINLELKHFCSDFNKIRNILKKLGAKKEAIKNQKDYFFNVPVAKSKIHPRLKLRIERGKQTLIYYDRPDFNESKNTASSVALHEVIDKELLPFLRGLLGIRAIVEKRREVWRKANTVFHLDTVKGVGKIFEIELRKKGKISKNDKFLFESYRGKLLPLLGPVIKRSNVDLIENK